LPSPNYGFAKRQKELAKKQRKEAKRQRKSQSEETTPTAKPEPFRVDEKVVP
jgi:hypothetical protein